MAETTSVSNGRDLASRIINHPQGGVDALLKFVEFQETEWLELKAALHPEDGQFEKNEKADDYRWHVAEAVVAMANSMGGVVLLGVDDNAQAVGLSASDPKNVIGGEGIEAFNRKVVLPALVRKKWATGRKGNIEVEGDLESLIEIQNAEYQGQKISVILVAPVAKDGDLLSVCELFQNREREFAPIRSRGNYGRVRELKKFKEISEHRRLRTEQMASPDFQDLWEKFNASLPPLSTETVAPSTPTIDETVEADLVDYCGTVASRFKYLHRLFTPLDAEEDRVFDLKSHAAFDPEAEELLDIFASDAPWEDDDWMDDENEASDEFEDNDEDSPDEPVPSGHASIAAPRRGGVFELLAQENQAVLVGEPGAGKTTLLQRLTLEDAANYAKGAMLTLFVPLRAYTDNGLRTLLGRTAKQPWPVIDCLLQNGRLRLLLDAINECPLHLQQRCCQEIKGLMRDYPDTPLVLSSRRLAYRCVLQLPVFSLLPLDQAQQNRFLMAYLNNEQDADAILAHLHGQPGGEMAASNPMLLRIVTIVYKRHGELPQGRAQLYRQFLKDWYDREQKKEELTGAKLRWNFFRAREALSLLAFESRKSGITSMSRDWAQGVLRPLLMDEVHLFLERMAQGLLLDFSMEEETLNFGHESVQEYLAAEHMVRNPEDYVHLPDEDHDVWHMSLAHVFELAENLPANFIEKAWQRNPLLVAVALRDEDALQNLPLVEGWDAWLTGMIRMFRGEASIPETNYLARNMLYPPMYPLSDLVSGALESSVFWYAGMIHSAGRNRLESLRRLIEAYEDPWLDVLLPACKGFPEWREAFEGSQKLLLDGLLSDNLKMVLNDLNLNQIAYLCRHQILKNLKTIKNKKTIAKANSRQLLSMATDSWRKKISNVKIKDIRKKLNVYHIPWLYRGLLQKKEIPLEILNEWKAIFSDWITSNKLLLVSDLFFKDIMSYDDIAQEKRRQLIMEMDANNIIMLVKRKAVFPEDIPDEIRQKFIKKINVNNALSLINKKIVRLEDISDEMRHQIVMNMDTDQVITLVKKNVIRSKDIPDEKNQQLIMEMDANNIFLFVSKKIIRPESLPDEMRQQIIMKTTNNQLLTLIHDKIIAPTDIPMKKWRQFFFILDPKRLSTIANDIPNGIRQQLIMEMDSNKLILFIKQKIIRPKDIPVEKWRRILYAMGLKHLCSLADDIPANIWQQIIVEIGFNVRQEIIMQMNIDQLILFINKKIIHINQIDRKKRQQIIMDMNANQVMPLVNKKIIHPGNIPKKKRQQIIMDMDANQIFSFVNKKIIRLEYIPKEKRQQIIMDMSVNQLISFFDNKIIHFNDIPIEKRQQIIMDMSDNQLNTFIDKKIIHFKDIPNKKRQQIIMQTNDDQLINFFKTQVIRSEDIPDEKRRQLIMEINNDQLINFIKTQVIRSEDIPDEKRQQIIMETNDDQLINFLKTQVIRSEDIPNEKRRQIIMEMSANNAASLLRNFIIHSEDIPDEKRRQIIMGMSADNAALLLRKFIIHFDEIPDEKRQNILIEMNAYNTISLLSNKIIHPTDIPVEKWRQLLDNIESKKEISIIYNIIPNERREQIIMEMTTNQLINFVIKKTINSKDIPYKKRQQIVMELNADNAIQLLNTKIIHPKDIPIKKWLQLLYTTKPKDHAIIYNKIPYEKRHQIIMQMDVNNMISLLNRKIIHLEDIPDEKRQQCQTLY